MNLEGRAIAASIFGYADETTIVVGRVDDAGAESVDEYVVLTVEGIVSDEHLLDVVRQGDEPPPPMFIDRRHRIVEWGASGAVLDVLMWVSSTVSAAALNAGVNRLLDRYRHSVKPLNRDQAEHKARQALLLGNRGVSSPDSCRCGKRPTTAQGALGPSST